MKERPIIFSGSMVRAIPEGRKTQTRRVVKFPHQNPLGAWEPTTFGGPGLYRDKACTIPANEPERIAMWHTRTADIIGCPYGVPGDRLWVRETHALDNRFRNVWCRYAADEQYSVVPAPELLTASRPGWRPSIHMPRWASRLTLEVVSVRVERLQEISGNDCIAEGCAIPASDCFRDVNTASKLRKQYETLWDSINAKRAPWESNPWVWVIEFRRAA